MDRFTPPRPWTVPPPGATLSAGLAILLCILLTACQRPELAVPAVARVTLLSPTSATNRNQTEPPVFVVGEQVRALIQLRQEAAELNRRPVVWHIQWLRPDGRRRYKKHLLRAPGDQQTPLQSSIRLKAKHGGGEYVLQIYRARLLVYEQRFAVRPP